ncbi:pentatricopeptide repeat-containing protein At4g01570 [Manihot esculenta]|nr:pentatricopeptide repeat-containing protein At4g01570 [Manihot esculenta]
MKLKNTFKIKKSPVRITHRQITINGNHILSKSRFSSSSSSSSSSSFQKIFIFNPVLCVALCCGILNSKLRIRPKSQQSHRFVYSLLIYRILDLRILESKLDEITESMSGCTAPIKKLRHACFGLTVKCSNLYPTSRCFRSCLFSSSSSPSKLEDILLVAFLTKNLSESGTRNLEPDSIPLSEPLVLQILRQSSLEPSRKIDFFKWCSLRHNYKHSACTYSNMFRTLCRAGNLEEIPNLLNLMKDDGVVVSSDTFKFLLDAFIRSGKFDFALEIFDHMEELGTNLNPHMYDSVIVALARKNQIGLALSIFFKLLEASNGMNKEDSVRNVGLSMPGSIACNALLVALRKADMRAEFRKVFDKLRATDEFELDTWGCNICIHAFGCWGDLATALMLFKEMKEKSLGSGPFGPDLCTYNSLIHVLCLFGKVNDALIVYEELKVSGHEPDAFTYRILIQGCSKSCRMNDTMKIFSEMQYSGFLPDTIVYNSLLDGMFKARKVLEACQLFEKMVQDGVRASSWTYNILIDGLCKNGRAEAGYRLFCDLKKKGKFVDAVTYSIIVLLLCREGQLEEALVLVEEMEERGFVVDLVTVSSLLIGFHKQGRYDCTEKLMKHIRDGNLVPNVLNWQADMEASLKNPQRRRKDYTPMFPSNGKLSEITSLLRYPDLEKCSSDGSAIEDENSSLNDTDQWSSSPYMDHLANQVQSNNLSSQLFSLSRGQRVQEKGIDSFDIDMVNTFLSIFLAKGKLSLACKLFEIFSDIGVNPVSYTYNSIMSSFVKKGYFNEAWDVLNEMGEKFCPADIATYNMIIQGLGKMGRADLAISVLDKLMKQGGYLDTVMYNTLINTLGKAGKIDEAKVLFEQMKSSGINPDVVTYNILIEIHSKAGHLKDAYKFLRMMLDAGCLPNHVTDTTLDFLAKEIEKQRYQKASILGKKDNST